MGLRRSCRVRNWRGSSRTCGRRRTTSSAWTRRAEDRDRRAAPGVARGRDESDSTGFSRASTGSSVGLHDMAEGPRPKAPVPALPDRLQGRRRRLEVRAPPRGDLGRSRRPGIALRTARNRSVTSPTDLVHPAPRPSYPRGVGLPGRCVRCPLARTDQASKPPSSSLQSGRRATGTAGAVAPGSTRRVWIHGGCRGRGGCALPPATKPSAAGPLMEPGPVRGHGQFAGRTGPGANPQPERPGI